MTDILYFRLQHELKEWKFRCVIVHSPLVLRRKSRAEPIPLFRGTLRLDCFPNGPGAMLSSKQIFQTGSSVRPTFVGHKVNWGEAGPGQGTPLSSLAAARRENGAQRLFIVAGPWLSTGPGEMRDEGRHQGPGSLTDRASAHRDPAGAPCPGRLIFIENKTLRTLVSKCNRQLCILNGSLQSLLQDGRQEPRGGRLDRRLPNPRAMSKKNHPDENKPDTRYTHMVMQFGQFLDHDLTLTPKDGRFWHFGTLRNNIEQKNRRVSPVFTLCYYLSLSFAPQWFWHFSFLVGRDRM